MDGRTDGGRDGRTDGRTDGRSDGRTVGRSDGRTVGRSDGRSDGRTVGRVGTIEIDYSTYDAPSLLESRILRIDRNTLK